MKKEENNKFSKKIAFGDNLKVRFSVVRKVFYTFLHHKIINWLYLKLFKINDTPQKIALGLGLGVFAGIFPGTGPAASLFLAFIFRANRASALIGSLLTNTWVSLVTFLLAIKLGAVIFGIKWQEIHGNGASLIKHFSWLSLFRLSTLKVILPVMLGFILIAFCFGLLVYLISLALIIKVRGGHKKEV